MLSKRRLSCTAFRKPLALCRLHNADSIDAAKWFAKDYGLGWGANILKMYFEMIGLINWMDERQEVTLLLFFSLHSGFGTLNPIASSTKDLSGRPSPAICTNLDADPMPTCYSMNALPRWARLPVLLSQPYLITSRYHKPRKSVLRIFPA